MTIRFRPYFDSDFLRIRDFLAQNAREADGSPTRQPWNWWIDRWNFTATRRGDASPFLLFHDINHFSANSF